MQINNLSFSQDVATLWPEGDYRGIMTFSDDQDEKIYAITFVNSVRNTADIQVF